MSFCIRLATTSLFTNIFGAQKTARKLISNYVDSANQRVPNEKNTSWHMLGRAIIPPPEEVSENLMLLYYDKATAMTASIFQGAEGEGGNEISLKGMSFQLPPPPPTGSRETNPDSSLPTVLCSLGTLVSTEL